MRLPAILACLLCLAAPAIAGDALWSGLVLATKAENAKSAPPPLDALRGDLKRVFGYNQFELLGHNTKNMDDLDERWLMPSREFFLRVEAKEKSEFGPLLDVEFYREKRLLLQTTLRLPPRKPVFIRGPQYGDGQLIIVLMMK